MLASRPDLVPYEFVEEFKKLQDHVPPLPYADIREVLESELEAPVEEVFAQFDPEAKAAASIAQVHLATLQTGERVIVKVQRPGIEEVIENDLGLLYFLSRLLEKYVPEARLYRPVAIIEEFARTIRREEDFLLEASNAERMRENFQDDPTIYIPKVFWELSRKRTLTLEWLDGVPVDELDKLREMGLDLKKLADAGCRSFLKQVFEWGFFHADPHPGNIMVLKNGIIAFVDFGIMGRLDERYLFHMANVMGALSDRDYERLADEFMKIGFLPPNINMFEFRNDLIDFIEPYYGRPLKSVPLAIVFSQWMKIISKHKIKAPADLLLFLKTLVFIDGIGRELDPDYNLLEVIKPLSKKLIKKRFGAKKLLDKTVKSVSDLLEFIRVFPQQFQLVMNKLGQNELEVKFMHTGLEDLIREQQQSYNRMAFALIVCGLIIGSCIIIFSNQRPYIFGIPALGLVGFIIAAALGLGLIVSMFLSRRVGFEERCHRISKCRLSITACVTFRINCPPLPPHYHYN